MSRNHEQFKHRKTFNIRENNMMNISNLNKTPRKKCKDNKVIKYIYKHINFLSEQPPKMPPYTFELINNTNDIHLLISYLDTNDLNGSNDILINILTEKFVDESFFFIPQLCSLLSQKKHNESLNNFLLDKCIDHTKFSLFVHWIISSYVSTSKEQSGIYSYFLPSIEMALVNGKRYGKFNSDGYHNKTDDDIFCHNINKQFKVNYFSKCVKFYRELKRMCIKLKDFPKEFKENPQRDRDTVMKIYLTSFNRGIGKMYYNEKGIENSNDEIRGLYRGIILPFDDGTIANEDCNLIVHFLPEYSSCISTKARVPVKVVFECVNVRDCAKWNDYIIDSSSISVESETHASSNQSSPISLFVNEKNENNKNCMIDKDFSSIDDFLQNFDTKNKINNSNSNSNINSSNGKLDEGALIDNNNNKIKDNFVFRFKRLFMFKEEECLGNIKTKLGNPFGEKWSDLAMTIASHSSYSNFPSYHIRSFIFKSNDDLRQEALCIQLIRCCIEIFKKEKIPLKLTPYNIIITSINSGLIEYLNNTISIDALKKKIGKSMDLNKFFRLFYSENLQKAQRNFTESLAGYSLITYILNLKDRHNGNILLDMNGNLIHIDFGFILGISPGNMNFETAPFKITKEYIDIIGGEQSELFKYFKSLLVKGFIALKENYKILVKVIEILARSKILLLLCNCFSFKYSLFC